MKGIAVWVPSKRPGYRYRLSGIDLLAKSMNPRPLYSERRRMERRSPTGLACYILLRSVYTALPDTRLVRWLWRNL